MFEGLSLKQIKKNECESDFKTFIKPFEAPQRSVKIKKVNFHFNTTFRNARDRKA